MAEILSFDQTVNLERKVNKLTEELEQRNEELKSAKTDVANLKGVNEMLKLQLADLKSTLKGQVNLLEQAINNIEKLEAKLPDL